MSAQLRVVPEPPCATCEMISYFRTYLEWDAAAAVLWDEWAETHDFDYDEPSDEMRAQVDLCPSLPSWWAGPPPLSEMDAQVNASIEAAVRNLRCESHGLPVPHESPTGPV